MEHKTWGCSIKASSYEQQCTEVQTFGEYSTNYACYTKKKKCAFKEKLKQNHLKRHKGFEQIRGRMELILTAFKGKMDVKNEVKWPLRPERC